MSVFPRAQARTGLMAAALVVLAGCSSLNKASDRLVEAVKPYRVDVVQGNALTREQVAVLKPGMSRLQVRDILGTPLLTSVFHGDRWDYVFTLRRQGVEPQARRVTVFFKGDVLERVESDELPTEAEFAATLDRTTVDPAKVPKLEASEDSLQKFPAPAQPAEAKPLPPLPASYPPLEPAVR